MSSYFTEYPKITVTNPINNEQIDVIDLFRSVKFDKDLTEYKNLYSTYYVKDGERPEQIAFNYYGDTKYYWIILLSNNITIDSWALSNYQVERILDNIPNQFNIKFYKTLEIKNNDGYIIIPSGLIVSRDFSMEIDGVLYNRTKIYTPVTYREDTIEKNDKKKVIILLDPIVVSRLNNDFKKLIQYQTNNLTDTGTKFEEI